MLAKKIILAIFFGLVFASGASAADASTVVVLTAPDWCRPCQQMDPIIKQLKKDGYPITIIDVDKNPNHGYQISSLPTTIFLNGKKEIDRIKGGVDRTTLVRAFAANGVVSAGSTPPVSLPQKPSSNFNSIAQSTGNISVIKFKESSIPSSAQLISCDLENGQYRCAYKNNKNQIIGFLIVDPTMRTQKDLFNAIAQAKKNKGNISLNTTNATRFISITYSKPSSPSPILPPISEDSDWIPDPKPSTPVTPKPVTYIYKLISVDYIPKSGTSYEIIVEKCGFDVDGEETDCEETIMLIKNASTPHEANSRAVLIVGKLNAVPSVKPSTGITSGLAPSPFGPKAEPDTGAEVHDPFAPIDKDRKLTPAEQKAFKQLEAELLREEQALKKRLRNQK